jgi:hypothetical protein
MAVLLGIHRDLEWILCPPGPRLGQQPPTPPSSESPGPKPRRRRKPLAKPSIKQHLAAIPMLCDWLVLGQIIERNPAASVHRPKHIVTQGKTPVLTQAGGLVDSCCLRRSRSTNR